MTSNEFKKRRRTDLFAEQGGKCHWCGEDMLMPACYPVGGTQDPRLCTLDHLFDRYDPRRWANTAGARYVAACLECNQNRGAARHAEMKQRGNFEETLRRLAWLRQNVEAWAR